MALHDTKTTHNQNIMEFNSLLYNEKYRIPTNRLTKRIYGIGFYHIVICTQDRHTFFGTIYNDEMHYTYIGNYARTCIENMTEHLPDTLVHRFQVMPNHIHLLLEIKDNGEEQQHNAFSRPGRLAIIIIRTLKSAISRKAKEKGILFGWQTRFYDTVIQHADQYSEINYYIQNNVIHWAEDHLYTANTNNNN